MSTGILDKLKIKPIPKKIEQFEVKFTDQDPGQKQDVIIRTKIIDRTLDKVANRDDLLKKFKTIISKKSPTMKIPEILLSRSGSKCELCGSIDDLRIH